jgi:3-hydroxyisobutyrate dehydrogenase
MKIAFLGTGLMGGLMAQRLLDKNYNVVVWNRTKSKTEKLKKHGALVAETPAEAISESELIITMLSDFNATSSVLFPEKISFKNKTVMQMGTMAPGESILLKERVEQLEGEYLECPVLGGIAFIPEGKLLPLVGASELQFTKWKSFIENFGEKAFHIGNVGMGASVKLAFNQLIASLTASFSMSLGYIRDIGIDPYLFMEILRKSSYYAPAFDKKLDSMIERDFANTNFPLKHLYKDVNLAMNEFVTHGINVSALDGVVELLKEGILNKLSDQDYAVIYNITNPKK